MINIENVKRVLDNEGLKYKSIADNSVAMQWTGKYNNDYVIFIELFEDENIGYIEVATGIYIKNITVQIWEKINHLNENLRWFRLYINNKKQLIMDNVVELSNLSSEKYFFSRILSANSTIDKIYPDIQRLIWNNQLKV